MTTGAGFRIAAALLLAAAAARPAMTAAQSPAAAAGEARTEPIRCWWKTDKAAVHVGEQFTLTLTCATIETPRLRVAADAAELEPSAVQLTPFDVVGGVRHDDLVEPPWRYSQHEYRLRLFGDEFFGQDIAVPAFTVPYTVQVTSGGTAQEGREQTYVLPPIPMRISSLVPADAADIRDASRQSFGVIEDRRLRAMVALVAGCIAFAFALALVALAAARAWRHRRRPAAGVTPAIAAAGILEACARELAHVRTDAAHGGWDRRLAERALAPLRVASAVALSHPFSQTTVNAEVAPRAGEMLLRRGRLRPKRVLVSARVTADMIAGQLARRGQGQQRTTHLLGTLARSLQVFTASRYGRTAAPDATSLQTALEDAAAAVRQLRIAALGPVRAARTFVDAATTWKNAAWRP
jgi:hypothetical protein